MVSEWDEAITAIDFNRNFSENYITASMITEVESYLMGLQSSPNIPRTVIFQNSDGKEFCSGYDYQQLYIWKRDGKTDLIEKYWQSVYTMANHIATLK